MGERKGTNKYYPPDFDPKKHRSLDAYHGTHPLRERAKKIKQGILVIRFEMPYNIWCNGCENPIGMGVRYNAEKSKVGNYYTTPIYQFRMKCHLCDTYFVIKTDPANHDYVIIEGARRKEQRWDPKDNEQIVTEDKDDVKKRALDAMYKLEHGVTDQTSQKKSLPGLSEIEDIQSVWKDDYLVNKALRESFRNEKKTIASAVAADNELLQKSSLDITLVKEDERDKRLAGLLKYKVVKSFDEREKEERDAISSRPILGHADPTSPTNPVEKAARTAAGLKRNAAFFAPKPRTVTAASLGIVHKNTPPKQKQVETTKDSASEENVSLKDAQNTASELFHTVKDSTEVGEGSSSQSTVTTKTVELVCAESETIKQSQSSDSKPEAGTSGTTGLGSLFANYDSSSSNSGSEESGMS